MKITDALLQGYEDMKLIRYDELDTGSDCSVAFDDLPSWEGGGVLKACRYVDGKLIQHYSCNENHVGVIAATRLGKTTSYVVPTIVSFARRKVKRSMVISDPKGELYRTTSETLRREGYRVLLLNFRDYLHSECWNPLTPIFRKYQDCMHVYDRVELVVEEDGEPHNKFQGKIYDDQRELDRDIERFKGILEEEVGNDIDTLASMLITTDKTTDPYWEDSARDVLKAFLWAMLEDSDPEAVANTSRNLITEETYSFGTILSILGTFSDGSGSNYDDDGYFRDRGEKSRAYLLAKNNFLENAPGTRKCILSTFNSKIAVFRESAMRLITSCNSFDMHEIAEGGPIAVFINYKDEVKAHYQMISLFVQDAYRLLIQTVNLRPKGKLGVPFYFILDEFGNFPALRDFDTTISACAGRNIFFILIIQSYAQLNNVYGPDTAEIIRDNLNMHVFFGSNNPKTLEEFSRECGEYTRISPLSALNGTGSEIEDYRLDTISLVPKSMLSYFQPGECIVTEANCGYVLFSRLERYFLCREFEDLPIADENNYHCSVDKFDPKYVYSMRKPKSSW